MFLNLKIGFFYKPFYLYLMFQKQFICELLTICSLDYERLYEKFLYLLVHYNLCFQNFLLMF